MLYDDRRTEEKKRAWSLLHSLPCREAAKKNKRIAYIMSRIRNLLSGKLEQVRDKITSSKYPFIFNEYQIKKNPSDIYCVILQLL